MTTTVDSPLEATRDAEQSHNMSGAQDDGAESREHPPSLPAYNINKGRRDHSQDKSSDEEGTVVGDGDNGHAGRGRLKENVTPDRSRPRGDSHLTLQTEYEPGDPLRSITSPSQSREQAHRLDDELALLKVERQISKQVEQDELARKGTEETGGGDAMYRSRSRRREEHLDDFDIATNPVHESTKVYKPLEHPSSGFAKFVKRLHGSNWALRYVSYITPLTLILLIPLLLGAFVFKEATVGGVYLLWFMVWLEIVWLTLWAGRILAKCLPWPMGLVSGLFTNNSKKWRDLGKQLEVPATIFFWWLGIEVSFLPTMQHHVQPADPPHDLTWLDPINKVLVSIFVASVLNFFAKIIIQLIAISFHLRTYADRIELNKFQIGSLTKLYQFSREKIAMDDSEFEARPEPGSGTRTPRQLLTDAGKSTKVAFAKFGDIAGKVAGDFTGKSTMKSTHPHQVTLALLNTTVGSQVLARRLYRTFAREDTESVYSQDLRAAFDNNDEADAAFSMFDKDMNGDISMEELESVCVEIGRERKSITASLKDLDSVVAKLDDVFVFIVFIITILVFISLISKSAAGVLTSAGSSILALSWLFSATAQEFLQSVVFVFVKHPFDVGDRVTIYGNTGALGKGDDYFVKEISLLYTEFKKMEGHVVQAPNNYLNTLFILNQRRSGGLAEAVSIAIKFGTTLDQIDGLRVRLLEFVRAEKREYQSNILTELRDIIDVHSINLTVVFFYKSNWQNEGLRLARRNKFICALMVTIQELGIEGPYMRNPGQKQSFPVYLQNVPHVPVPGCGHSGHPDAPEGIQLENDGPQDPPFVSAAEQDDRFGSLPPSSRLHSGSILKGTRKRGESLSQMNRRVDFSLGAKHIVSGDFASDVYEDRSRVGIPIEMQEASAERERSQLRMNHDIGMSSSRDERHVSNGLARRSTESGSRWRGGSVHRNRLFGRGRDVIGDDETLLETGQMANIPENPSYSAFGAPSEADSHDRSDPRPGMVSTAAWRVNTNESNVRPQLAAAGLTFGNPLRSATTAPAGQRLPGRSQTADFEMRRFR